MCVCLSTCVRVYSCTWVHVCAEAIGLCGMLFLRNHLPWSFWGSVSHWDPRLAHSVRLASRPQGSICLCLPSAGFIEVHHQKLHTWVLGIKLESPWLYFSHWTISPVPTVLFLEIVEARKGQSVRMEYRFIADKVDVKETGKGASGQTQRSWTWIDVDCCLPSNGSGITAPKSTNLIICKL